MGRIAGSCYEGGEAMCMYWVWMWSVHVEDEVLGVAVIECVCE